MGIAYNTSTVRDGLVLHLDAANPKSYPGSGTVWTDVSGQGNNGTLSNVTYSPSPTGNMLFDANDDNVLISNNSSFSFSGNFTVSAWIKVNAFNTSGIWNVISKKLSFNNNQPGWSCQYDYRTPGVLQFRNNNGTVTNDSTPTSPVNNTALLNQTTAWANSAWVISGTTVTFYINGQPRGSASIAFTNTDTTNNLYIGKSVGSIGDPALFMNITGVNVYNRVLSATEIEQNFEATRGRYGI
jgi:hypothetical protein